MEGEDDVMNVKHGLYAAASRCRVLTYQVVCCSGPLPGGNISNVSNLTNFFPALRAFNASHNQFTGDQLPCA